MPRDFIPRTNHAVQRHCGNGFEMFQGFQLSQRCISLIA
jgi:hypothetical protein